MATASIFFGWSGRRYHFSPVSTVYFNPQGQRLYLPCMQVPCRGSASHPAPNESADTAYLALSPPLALFLLLPANPPREPMSEKVLF